MANQFPPKKARKNADPTRGGNVGLETGPVSTGSGGIPASLKIKKAGTPNLEAKDNKTVAAS